MPDTDILGYPSRYILEKVELEGFSGEKIDIADTISSIHYVEDIFSPGVYGTCTVSDSLDLCQYFPICGEETLRIVYRSSPQDPEVDKTFQIYRVGEKRIISNEHEGYTLFFCSPELVTDRKTKISKSYNGYTTTEIVQDIHQTFLDTDKELVTDSSLESLHIIIPNYSPFEAIQFCSSISRSTESNGALFSFFEDRDGYRFANIENLFLQSTALENPIPALLQSVSNEDNASDRELFPSTSLMNFTVERASKDSLSSLIDGVFSNRVIGIDFLTRSHTVQDYNYEDDFQETLHLDRYPLKSNVSEIDGAENRISIVPTGSIRRDSEYIAQNSTEKLIPAHESIVGKRTAQLGQLATIVVKGTLYGFTRATAGITLNLDIPNHTKLEDKRSNISDKYLSGKYLVTRCEHVLTPLSYTVDATFMKDTLNTELEYDLD